VSCKDKSSKVRNVMKKFLECTAPFFNGEFERHLSDEDNFFVTDFAEDVQSSTLDEYFSLTLNPEHKFWTEYPFARWFVQIVVKEYLLSTEHYQNKYEPDVSEFYDVRKNIRLRLMRALETLIHGLDLDVISAIGGERYETSEAKNYSLTLVPYPINISDIKGLFPSGTFFDEAVHFELTMKNAHAVRKQLNMCNGSTLGIYTELKNGVWKLKTFGLLPIEAMSKFPHITYKKNQEWEFFMPREAQNLKTVDVDAEDPLLDIEHPLIEYSRGRLLCPSLETVRWYGNELSRLLSDRENQLKGCLIKKYSETLNKIVQLAKKHAEKGALIFFSETDIIKKECERLCKMWKRGILFDTPVKEIDKNVIKRLCAIDGAMMVGFTGECFGCGIIIDGEVKIKGDMSRGARYNSAINYVETFNQMYAGERMIGIVVSEDGMVNLLPKQ